MHERTLCPWHKLAGVLIISHWLTFFYAFWLSKSSLSLFLELLDTPCFGCSRDSSHSPQCFVSSRLPVAGPSPVNRALTAFDWLQFVQLHCSGRSKEYISFKRERKVSSVTWSVAKPLSPLRAVRQNPLHKEFQRFFFLKLWVTMQPIDYILINFCFTDF